MTYIAIINEKPRKCLSGVFICLVNCGLVISLSLSALYHAISAQLAKDVRKYRITTAIGKRNNTKAEELLYDLIDSKTVLPCCNSTNPRVRLTDTKDFDSYKLYLSDTGLFVTLMFIDRSVTENDIYAKLLSDKLPANLGYLYENLVAQMIAASGRELYYHTWGNGKRLW